MGDTKEDTSYVYQNPDKDIYFLGRNLSEFPCFRTSLLTGIFSGIGTGMGYFLYSSRPAHSSHVAMGMFVVSTLSYWTFCRYQFLKVKLEIHELQDTQLTESDVKPLDVEARRKELEEQRKKS